MTDSAREGALYGPNALDDFESILRREADRIAEQRAARRREEEQDDQRRADFVCRQLRGLP